MVQKTVQAAVPDLQKHLAHLDAQAFEEEKQASLGEAGAEGENPEGEEDTLDIDAILRQSTEIQYSNEDLDAFWDSVIVETKPKGLKNTGSLSFDQAFKLGLAPEDNKD